MNIGKQCMHCFSGMIVNGVCNRCHSAEQTPEMRRTYALPIHTTLHDRYYIGNVLGCGGFGITYSAWDTQENKCVAIKELFPNKDVVRQNDRHTVSVVSGQENYFSHVSDCFVGEAKLLINLQTVPGIVSIYNLFSENGTLYYAMEYLEGMNLKERLEKRGLMTWNQFAPILSSMFNALENLHKINLIHRDISPDNIFLTNTGEYRLIDFGSVRTYVGAKSFTTFMKHNFAPLEQYQSNGHQGPWTDIYALSVTTYYSLTGKLPPKATDRFLDDTLQPLGTLCPQLPKHVVSAIHKGMAVHIENRYQDVRQFARDVFHELNSSGQTLTPQQILQQQQQQAYLRYQQQQQQQIQRRQPVQPPQQQQQIHQQIAPVTVTCMNGAYRGRQWQLRPGSQIRIGRRPDCEVRYPQTMSTVSGSQCTFTMDMNGIILVKDDGSSNGTTIETTRMQPGVWYKAARGCRVLFAYEEYVIQ